MDIFCRIIKGEIKSEIVAEAEDWLAIKDIQPQAPVHILIIPKQHLELNQVAGEQTELLGKLLLAAKQVAAQLGIAETGYRLVINQGKDGGQLVPHLHIHLLGGKTLKSSL
ncbi:MAG: putative HIT family protein [Parcubacteria group bacterium GW2011_GWB1_48_6]|nr:MAG: putative HIT family protein [Parcubacteria group bacterium GW2011_GWB1_48_6]HXK35944.1 HIT domain-containing protein [Candidatus Paceibacterota bacterium]